MSRSEYLGTPEKLMESINNGWDIFERELEDFQVGVNISNPFTEDNTPSARVKQSSSGLWLLYTYNDGGKRYNAIQFIQKKYGLRYLEAINYIQNNIKLDPVILKKEKLQKKKRNINIQVNKIVYTKEHEDYFNLPSDFLEQEMQIFAIESYYLNGHLIKAEENLLFAYEYLNPEGERERGKYKILTLGPNVEKKDKWKNNIPFNNFFYIFKINNGDKVYVCKSNKDASICQYLGYKSIAVLNEGSHGIIEGLKELMLNFPSTEFILFLGADTQAMQTMKEVQKEINLKSIFTPVQYLPYINDLHGYYLEFGLEKTKQLMYGM